MYSEAAALKVRAFLEGYCRLSKAPWNGKALQLLPWQWHDIVSPLYGTLRDDGSRQYKRAVIFIPKKQGKSTLMSGLALYHLLEQPGSEVYVIASDVQQAGIVYGEAANMAEASPALSKRLWTRRNVKAIEDRKAKSVLRVLSSEPTGKAGFNANCIIYDELAEWPKAHARDVWDQLYNACMARVNGLQIVISTAQYDKTHIGFEQYSLAKKVKADPSIDPTLLPVIYEVGEHEDWRNPENWWKANPSAGITVPKDYYRDAYRATESNPLAESSFRTLLLNQWVGAATCWIASDVWDACGADYTEDELHGASAWVGIDYARKHDLCAYVVLVEREGLLYLLPRFFIPKSIAREKEARDAVPYLAWARDPRNNLHLTDGDVVDPAYMRRQLLADAARFELVECGYDPYGMEESRQILEMEHGLPMVEVPQTWARMAPATGRFERLVTSGKLRHPRNPVLSWNLGNCVVRQGGTDDGVMIDKRRTTARCDGVTAAIIALSRQMALPATVYHTAADLLVF